MSPLLGYLVIAALLFLDCVIIIVRVRPESWVKLLLVSAVCCALWFPFSLWATHCLFDIALDLTRSRRS